MTSGKLYAGILAASILLSACDSDDDIAALAVTPTSERTLLQIVHAVPDAPAVDIPGLIAGLAFGEATVWIPVDAGTASVQVDARVPGGSTTVIPTTELTIDADDNYTVIAVGEAASGTIAPIVVANPASPPAAGNFRVNVVHAAPNANNVEADDAVDIYVTAPGADLSAAAPIAGGATPFGASSGPLEVPAGDYQIRATAPGAATAVFDSGPVALAEGADLVVVAIDNTGPGAAPISLLVADGLGGFSILDAATPAEVRVVHAVPDAPAVDVFINDNMAANAPALSNLAFAEVQPGPNLYAELAPGLNNVLVTASGNPGVIAIPATDLDLAAGGQYTVYASGTFATIAPFVTEDDDRSIVTEAQVRILHLAPSAGLVDIYVQAPATDINMVDPTLEDVDFLADTGYLSLAGGDYEVTVTLADTKTAAIGPLVINIVEGGVYTAAARDPDPNLANDSFGLILLDDF